MHEARHLLRTEEVFVSPCLVSRTCDLGLGWTICTQCLSPTAHLPLNHLDLEYNPVPLGPHLNPEW